MNEWEEVGLQRFYFHIEMCSYRYMYPPSTLPSNDVNGNDKRIYGKKELAKYTLEFLNSLNRIKMIIKMRI